MGYCCPESNNTWFKPPNIAWNAIALNNAEAEIVKSENSSWLCIDENCGACALSVLKHKQEENTTYKDFILEYKKLSHDFGSTSADRTISKLSCHRSEKCGLIKQIFDLNLGWPNMTLIHKGLCLKFHIKTL